MNNNMARLKEIALILEDIKDDVVFVGGATVGLYIDDKAAPTPQPSEDIDCVVEIATYGEWTDFEAKLRKKGFQDIDTTGEDTNPPTCRKYFLGMKVDFMPMEETVLGYGNPWFKKGLENSMKVDLEEIQVNIFAIEYFVATKLKAFNDRGLTGDIRFSQDLEDLTELIDGATRFEIEVLGSDEIVRDFIIGEFKKVLANKDLYKEAMYGFLGYDDSGTREARVERIFNIVERICR
jgi:hypothetical protein